MANTLEYILKIKDEATSQLQKFSGELKNTGSKISSLGTQFNNFGKQAIGGFTVAAGGVMALGKELDLLTRGGQLLDVENAFNRLAMNAGSSGQKLLDTFQKVTDGTVANSDLMQRSVKASMLGIPIDKMSSLMEIARTQAVTMGEDVGYMLDSIVTGVGRASPLILDNLGITLKMGEVYDNAAKKLGKTAEAMTDAERRTALLNAVIAWGEQKQKDMGGAVDSNAGSFQRLSAEMKNLSENVLKQLSKDLTPIIQNINQMVKNNPELISKLIQLATVFGVILPMFAILGGAINGVIATFKLLKTSFLMAKAVLVGLAEAFGVTSAVMLGWIFVIGYVVAAITYLIQNWETLQKNVDEIVNQIQISLFNLGYNWDTTVANLKTSWDGFTTETGQKTTILNERMRADFSETGRQLKSTFGNMGETFKQTTSMMGIDWNNFWSSAISQTIINAKEVARQIQEQLITPAYNWGKNLIEQFGRGIKDAAQSLYNNVKETINQVKRLLEGHSPPQEGPLKNIDKWGYNIGKAWTDGLKNAISDFDMPRSGNTYTNNINVTAPINNNLDPYNLASILGQQLAFSGQYD